MTPTIDGDADGDDDDDDYADDRADDHDQGRGKREAVAAAATVGVRTGVDRHPVN